MVLVMSPCAFFLYTWCHDGGGEDSASFFFSHVVVVVTKSISSHDTRRPVSKHYYAGLSPADFTIKVESTRFSCKPGIKLFV